MTPERLIELMLAADFSWQELEHICCEFLGLDAEQAADIMAERGRDRRIADLVAWADRQGKLGELTRGVFRYGADKRTFQAALATMDMQQSTSQSEQPYTLLRLETKVDRVLDQQTTIISEQSDLKRRMTSVETMANAFQQRQSPMVDRLMVAMLALAMLAMLGFNMVSVLR